MARFKKDVISAGTYSVPTRDGGRHTVTFTSDEVRQMHRNAVGQMRKSKALAPPFCAEHQDGAVPQTEAERLANTVYHHMGHGVQPQLEGDTLSWILEVPDEKKAKDAESVQWVSPEIQYDWKDGDGQVWPGPTITHIACTARPVQMNQQPFQRLSLIRLSLADRVRTPAMDLSKCLAYLAKRKIKLSQSTTPSNLLKRLHVVRLGFEEGDEGEAKADKAVDEEGGADKSLKKVLEYLEGQMIHLPPDTTADNFIDRLCVACHALENAKPGDDVEAEAGTGTEAKPEPAPGGPMMMSLTKRAERAEAKLIELNRKDMERRIKALKTSSVIDKPLQDELLKELTTERLSLTDTAELALSGLASTVKAYERLAPGTAVRLGGGTPPTPVPEPDDSRLDPSVMSRLTGGSYVPKNGR